MLRFCSECEQKLEPVELLGFFTDGFNRVIKIVKSECPKCHKEFILNEDVTVA